MPTNAKESIRDQTKAHGKTEELSRSCSLGGEGPTDHARRLMQSVSTTCTPSTLKEQFTLNVYVYRSNRTTVRKWRDLFWDGKDFASHMNGETREFLNKLLKYPQTRNRIACMELTTCIAHLDEESKTIICLSRNMQLELSPFNPDQLQVIVTLYGLMVQARTWLENRLENGETLHQQHVDTYNLGAWSIWRADDLSG